MSEITVLPLELRYANDNDDHYLEGLCVPYGRTTMKAGQPRGERFLPGAFASVAKIAARKVRLVDSHLDGPGNHPVGVGVDLAEHADGLHGRFRFYATVEGRAARERALEDGIYEGLSVGFVATGERRGSDGAREITAAQLHHVALVQEPAYDDAKVLAVRAAATPDVTALLERRWSVSDFPDAPDVVSLVFERRSRR